MTEEFDDDRNENDAEHEKILSLSDRFIDLANELADADAEGNSGDVMDIAAVSLAMTFAAARYSAFLTSHEYDNAHQMRNDRRKILSAHASEFRQMLEQNLEDFELDFESEPGSALH